PVTATRTLAETVPSSCRTRVGSAVALPMMTVWMSRMAVSFLKAGRSRRRHRADAPQRPGLMAAVPGNGRLCGRGRSVEERSIRGGTGPRRLRAARGRFGADARGGCVPDGAGPTPPPDNVMGGTLVTRRGDIATVWHQPPAHDSGQPQPAERGGPSRPGPSGTGPNQPSGPTRAGPPERDRPEPADQAEGTTRPEAPLRAASKRAWTSAQFTMSQIALT